MHDKSIVGFKRLVVIASSVLLVFTAGAVITSPLAHAVEVWALGASGELYSYDTSGPVGGGSEVALHQNFDDHKAGTALSKTQIQAAFRGTTGAINRASPGVTVVADPANSGRGNALRVFFPKGKYGNRASGAAWQTRLPPRDEYYFAYDMYVPVGFNWPLSSKLPGLFGGDLSTVTGGGSGSDGIQGWAARQVVISERKAGDTGGFRNVGDGNIGARPHVIGKVHKITYARGKDSARLQPGHWTRIEQHVKFNDVGKKNGVYEAWVDGAKVFSETQWEYRKANSLKIDAVSFVWYYGGAGDTFAAREDQAYYFDNFVVSTQPIPAR